MNWFERLTGFTETDFASTRSRLVVEGPELVSRVNGRRSRIGTLELPSLGELRACVAAAPPGEGSLRVRGLNVDVRSLHARPDHDGSLFQVASQFNMLEMVGPSVVPEDGVSRYEHDHTQGPACAIAAGAATIYRNYFVPIGDQVGQSRDRQLDGLADVGAALSAATGVPLSALWSMENGYALCTRDGLAAIDRHLESADEPARDTLRARLRVGLHWDVEVTDAPGLVRPTVSQAFCSALPVAYSRLPADRWERFARLVLEAAYEATVLAAVLNAARGGSNVVTLTRLGGGAFGNDGRWIDDAMARALALASGRNLDVRVISRSEPSAAFRRLELLYPAVEER
jgi:hypothetical protein